MRPPWQLIALAAFVGGAMLLWLREHRVVGSLRDAIATERAALVDLAWLRTEHARLEAEQIPADVLERMRAARGTVERLRSEVEALERSVRERAAANRGPLWQRAMSLPELAFAGRDSPEEAFQTLMWAAFTGDDEILATCVIMTPNNRREGYAALAQLPVSEQVKYATPEKLWLLFLAPEMLKWKRVQIIGEKTNSPNHVVLTLRPNGSAREDVRLPLQRDRSGWHAVVPEPHMRAIANRLKEAADP